MMNKTTPPPLIGVIACGRAVEGEPAQAVKHRYLEAVTRHAGAVAVIVPTNQPIENAAAIVARLDAILLTGSNSNIEPARYGSDAPPQAPHDAARDGFAVALVQAARAADKPIFGICRGFQEINVALGGTLTDTRHQDARALDHHAPEGAELGDMFGHSHEIAVVPQSPLGRYVGAEALTVNSVHHQVVDRLAAGLEINARSADGVIEAFSAEGAGAPVFAVQWHPEWLPETRPHDLGFWTYLGEAARAAQGHHS